MTLRRTIMTSGRYTRTYVGIGILGAVAGVVAGILLAPAPGRDTRRRVGQRLALEKDALVRRGQLAVEGVTDVLEEGKRIFDRAANG
jgi:gas vesicle protein